MKEVKFNLGETITVKNLPNVNDGKDFPFSFSFFKNFLFLINRINSEIIIFDIFKKEIVNSIFVENKFINGIHIDSLNGIVFLLSHKKIYSALIDGLLSGVVGFSEINYSRRLEKDEFFNGIVETIPEEKEIFFVVQTLRKATTKIIYYHATKNIFDILVDDESENESDTTDSTLHAKTSGYQCKYFTEIVPNSFMGDETFPLIRGIQYLPREKKLMVFSYTSGDVYLMNFEGSILQVIPAAIPKNFWNFHIPSNEETFFVSLCLNNAEIQIRKYDWFDNQMKLISKFDFGDKIPNKKHFPIAVGPEGTIFVFDMEKTFHTIRKETVDVFPLDAHTTDLLDTTIVPPLPQLDDGEAEKETVADDFMSQSLSSSSMDFSVLINKRLTHKRPGKILLTFSKINENSKKARITKSTADSFSSLKFDLASFFHFPKDFKPSMTFSPPAVTEQFVLDDEDWISKNPLFPEPENCEWKHRSDSLCDSISLDDFFLLK